PSANAFRGPPRTTGGYRRGRDRFPPAAASSPRSGRCEQRRGGRGGNQPVQPARALEQGGRRPPWRRSHRRQIAPCAHRRRPPTARWSQRRARGNGRAEKPPRDGRTSRGRARRWLGHPSDFFHVLVESKIHLRPRRILLREPTAKSCFGWPIEQVIDWEDFSVDFQGTPKGGLGCPFGPRRPQCPRRSPHLLYPRRGPATPLRLRYTQAPMLGCFLNGGPAPSRELAKPSPSVRLAGAFAPVASHSRGATSYSR